jgi:nicotinate-nucleotide adenylyltransferase
VAHIGILGGTFNPPHRGHLALARQARAQLGLDRVLVVPANVAPNKPASAQDPGAARRLAMCELALAGEPGLQACSLEIERGGTSYTVDTVQAVHDAHPDAELTLIVGTDTARTLPGWREPARLLGMVGLAVAQRDAAGAREVGDALAAIPGLRPVPPVTSLRMEPVAVSSSLVRERTAAGQSIADLVGAPVARYIAKHSLYRAPSTTAPSTTTSSTDAPSSTPSTDAPSSSSSSTTTTTPSIDVPSNITPGSGGER